MIAKLTRLCVENRFMVLLVSALLAVWGVWVVLHTPVDALPDLSDIQVIIRTPYPGQAPRLVEDQVTYPLTRAMLTVPGARAVRGFSSFGDSFVYVIFDDDTDLYWARSRVLENLNQVQSSLPAGVSPSLGPDATGVGWIFEYALVDRSGRRDLADLRSLQDWLLRFELSSVEDVAEVAAVGGAVRQYQIVADPVRMAQLGVTLEMIMEAVAAANQETGGSVVEQAGAEYMVKAGGYLQGIEDFEKIPVMNTPGDVPVFLEQVADIRLGPEMRRGIADLDGQGEVAGGVVLMRSGKNARRVVEAVRAKLEELKPSLPEGVEIVTVYDRGQLIDRAVGNLRGKLAEEFVVVALTCAVFLLHLRSSLVAIFTLPLGLLISFIIMYYQGVSANIMSLGGLGIAIGTMVDAAIVMVENSHKKLERWRIENGGAEPAGAERWRVMTEASCEVGPAIFVSLLIITLSFIPVFALEGQEGRLFGPLAFTKTYAMAGGAFLSVTLIPVLMGYLIRGRVPEEHKNPINRFMITIYQPFLNAALKRPWLTLALALAVLVSAVYPARRLGGEFLPGIDEGDLLYMPSTLPGLSVAEAGALLQTTNKLIMTVPEVEQVFGKAGRAETATDPAPMEMIESTIRLKPESQWRPGMTAEGIVAELDRTVRLPGVANLWVPPIRNRIDMISTGVKSPVGIKVSGDDLEAVDRVARDIQNVSKTVPGVTSALAETVSGGRYLDVEIDREKAARYGLSVAAVQQFVSAAVGGMTVGETVEGVARYPINIRYPQSFRDSREALESLPILTESGRRTTLGEIASVKTAVGPSMLRTEQGRPTVRVYLDTRGRDMVSVVEDLRRAYLQDVDLPPGVSLAFTGQYESLERAAARLRLMIPATLIIIFILLYSEFKSLADASMIMASLPFSLVGGVWFMHLKGYALSVASGVGFIALAGLAAEFGVIMLIYLRQAAQNSPALESPGTATEADVDRSINAGATLRVRPKAMTVGTVVVSLVPIFWSAGTGSEVMRRISAPLFGGMITAFTLSMFIIPAAYKLRLLYQNRLAARKSAAATSTAGTRTGTE
ncbi:MAG: CusA/CzcA family heavy metal efflux RND transporter [Deltaproteobacteria bacterium]|jgi:Cu(I)/Ag(I) efflux system membrane protein CusA/SilA|nr:CusA/CzcA family heavy metal efflux RND transporter [Deltaproteobacteria bacterium]